MNPSTGSPGVVVVVVPGVVVVGLSVSGVGPGVVVVGFAGVVVTEGAPFCQKRLKH